MKGALIYLAVVAAVLGVLWCCRHVHRQDCLPLGYDKECIPVRGP